MAQENNSTIILVSLVFLAIITASCKLADPSQKPFVTSIDGVDIVSLYGTWEEMGEQYGKLAGSHLRHVKDYMSDIIDGNTSKRDSINILADKLCSRYPYRLRQFFRGMEKTSGLSLKELTMINAVEYSEGYFCSGIAAWGDYASGDLVYGRNYDAISYSPIAEDIIVTVFHPSDGSLATATIGYAGEIYAVNAINEKGLFIELNNGMATAGFSIDFDHLASTTSLLEVMFDADDIDYLDAFLKTSRSFSSFIIGVADENEARSYEWCASGTKNATGANPEGLMVQTNHYVNPTWTYPVPTDESSWNSITRRSNLLALAELEKGRIDEAVMCKIIATPIPEGGAMHDKTRYQLVYTPKTKKLLVCIEQKEHWAEIDLNNFL